MRPGKKQISFDLDTNALKQYYPSQSWNNAYEIIKRYMIKQGFSWIQGSVYISNRAITSTEVTGLLDKLVQQNPWLSQCMRDCREAHIGKEHSKNHLFDKSVVLPNLPSVKTEEYRYFYLSLATGYTEPR